MKARKRRERILPTAARDADRPRCSHSLAIAFGLWFGTQQGSRPPYHVNRTDVDMADMPSAPMIIQPDSNAPT